MYRMFYVNDELEGKFLYRDNKVVLYRIVLYCIDYDSAAVKPAIKKTKWPPISSATIISPTSQESWCYQ